MREMVEFVAQVNGFTLAGGGGSNYSLHMTVPSTEWYNWQHWGLGFSAAGHIGCLGDNNGNIGGGGWPTVFLQTMPGDPITWGDIQAFGLNGFWEADRAAPTSPQLPT